MEFEGFSLSLCVLNAKRKLNSLRIKNAYSLEMIIRLFCLLALTYPYFCRSSLKLKIGTD